MGRGHRIEPGCSRSVQPVEHWTGYATAVGGGKRPPLDSGKEMKSGFLEKLIGRLGKIDAGEVQNYFLRLAQEKGFLETVFNAIQEGIILLAYLLRAFRFDLVEGHVVMPLQRVTLRPREGLKMHVKRRDRAESFHSTKFSL